MRSVKYVCRNTLVRNKVWGVEVGGMKLENIFTTLLKEFGTDEFFGDVEIHITPKESTVLVDVGNRKYASLEDFEEAIDEQKTKEADPES